MTMTSEGNVPDDDVTTAAIEMVGRTGATQLEAGWHEDHPAATRWWAHATYQGARISVDGCDGPATALQKLAQRLLHGGRCTGCRRLIAMSADPVPMPAQMLDGDLISPGVEQARGLCRWNRQGSTWVRGCGPVVPDNSTREKLARALADANAPLGMVAAAREGRWDEYLSDEETPFPLMLLVQDLRANDLEHLVDRVKDGDFDCTKEESDAWAQSEDGKAAYAELLQAPPKPPTAARTPWRANTRHNKRPRR